MKSLAKALALSALGLLLTPHLHAADPTLTTLTCADEDGVAQVNSPVFGFNVNTDKTAGVLDATVYLDLSSFPTLLSNETAYFYSCVIGTGASAITLSYASVADVSASGFGSGVQGAASQVYASVIFFPAEISYKGVTFSVNPPPDAEAKAKAVAAIRSRVLGIPK